MFIYYFSRIELPYELLAPAFGHDGSALIKQAVPEGVESRATVRCGPAVEREGVTVLPIRVEGGSRFRRLDADVELALVESDLCQLTLSGSYEPALEASHGRGNNRTAHRVAEGFARDLIDNLSARLAGVKPSSAAR